MCMFRLLGRRVYAGLDDKGEALARMERSIADRSQTSYLSVISFEFDELHGDQRFKAVLKRGNLPE